MSAAARPTRTATELRSGREHPNVVACRTSGGSIRVHLHRSGFIVCPRQYIQIRSLITSP